VEVSFSCMSVSNTVTDHEMTSSMEFVVFLSCSELSLVLAIPRHITWKGGGALTGRLDYI
jgi:hypothetical protein